ncbi:hypothetical protein SPRG_08286 [Saprolegnia parasitica CBS 223.65]|uniref:Uncharacterized protein n=1 Tax=Saprolegnia parasitica (strain CBS 223.65) TaxID=695850 RepID=A0A067C7I5_SAPPC|nr:hypothetical protein SPRG_08286 [Saprolegnia parasitica CBS 223.65]KDO26483.1 hypothetical protein SPRG_08286 [Saprolegnia parasitica CBS 223.65]|eukprot:XP_012202918.1 hypothetical protein SPRG_08286 [Saprolegnia parasitica CBS 223.65]
MADPVPALPLYPSTRGFHCLRANCVYYAHDEATMRRHVKSHGTKPALGTTFARCKVQQIAKGKYISVTLAQRGDIPLSTLTEPTALTNDDATPPTVVARAEPVQESTPTVATTVAGREPVTEEASAPGSRRGTWTQRQVCWPYRFTKRSTPAVIDLTMSPPVVVDLTLSDDESESDLDLPLSPHSYADLCRRARNATDTYNV